VTIPRKRSKRPAISVAPRKRSKPAIPSEHTEQVNFVRWFRLQYRDVLIFAIPNGEQRNKITGAKLKAEGVTAGVPDLFIPAWKLFIEMKRSKGGSLSAVQKERIKELEEAGYRVFVCKGFDDAREQVQRFRGEFNCNC